ncbi:dTDP-4-dehydrorhamnose 3,5-epimerase [Halolamina pelagica]|uniref:dTDP-4-dehydrorhamnose 3,5-epimerase n=1 Tax=Halolamina pelagica TaxID=699431 RepID=A0A0P7HRK0_9EURY|nr:dTDP-4-dehydrorhamnose 3,5-epimerase [Halolamina pelagica]
MLTNAAISSKYSEPTGRVQHRPSHVLLLHDYPGIIRAWHRHLEGQNDHFVCPQGRIKVGVYDDRDDSPTQGELNTFVIGEHNQKLIHIPGDCWHGFKAIGDKPALLINYPTELYDYENPDEERIPYDTDKIPLDWEEPPHE